MRNGAGVVLACVGLFAAVAGPFGVRVGATVAGLLLFVASAALLIDVDGD